MFVIFDKRTGALRYSIETDVENVKLDEIEGLIKINQKINILNFYIDLETFELREKIKLNLKLVDEVLYIESDSFLEEITLRVENDEGAKAIQVFFENKLAVIPCKIQTDKRTVISAFSYKTVSNTLVINEKTIDNSTELII